jgi:hypothetical protein
MLRVCWYIFAVLGQRFQDRDRHFGHDLLAARAPFFHRQHARTLPTRWKMVHRLRVPRAFFVSGLYRLLALPLDVGISVTYISPLSHTHTAVWVC